MGLARAWTWLRHPSALAILDQGVVSGTSFITTWLIGRFSTPAELGLYSLGLSVVLGLLVVQMSLITTPYAVHRHTDPKHSASNLGSTFVMQVILMGLALAGLVVALLVTHGPARILVCAAIPAVPLLLTREFTRRLAFARVSMAGALAIDLPVAAIQAIGLIVLAWMGRLSGATAFCVLGAAAAIGTVVGLSQHRGRSRFHRADFDRDVRRHWNFGRWIAGAQLLAVVNTQGTFWLVDAVRGTTETGIFAACLSIVLLSNPFVLAVGNLLTPRAAQTYAEQGFAGLRTYILQVSGIIALVMGCFCVVLALGGDWLVQLLYGSDYAGHGTVITLLGITFLIGAVSMAVNDALRAVGRTNVEFAAMAIDAVVTVGLGLVGLYWMGLVGLAIASLLGAIAALVFQVALFARQGRST